MPVTVALLLAFVSARAQAKDNEPAPAPSSDPVPEKTEAAPPVVEDQRAPETKPIAQPSLVDSSPSTAPAQSSVLPVDQGGNSKSDDKEVPRRSGVLLLATFGGGTAVMSGYPNDLVKFNDVTEYRDGGVMLGGHAGGALMGALSPYVNVGFFGSYGAYSNDHWKSSTVAGGVRLEAFPLAAFRRAEDLGISFATGIGSAKLTRNDDRAETGAAVAQSYISLGAFYELRLVDAPGGHIVFSPGIQSDFVFGQTGSARSVSLSGRLAFYGGP